MNALERTEYENRREEWINEINTRKVRQIIDVISVMKAKQ